MRSKLIWIHRFSILSRLSLMLVAPTAQAYDLVILNGRVIDPETSFDAIRNVAVKDGKIVKITKEAIKGAETIDASGHVVAPGFVDGRVHVVDAPPGQKAALRDGVTTTLDLEVGAYLVDEWYDDLAGRSQTNYGAVVSVAAAGTEVFKPGYKSTYEKMVKDDPNHYASTIVQNIIIGK